MGVERFLKTGTAIVGAGPAGLTAAYEIKKAGGCVTVFDENARPGGQLFKQIHKFFGSSEHGAGIRGIDIGYRLMEDCRREGVEIYLNASVYGIFPGNMLGVIMEGRSILVEAEKILIASGATEKALAFDGWDKPGVMGAGAFQTMMNVNYVLPGKNVVMIGSGNVGLVTAYQILQAGGKVAAVVEAAPAVNGYAVHGDKLRRHGVQILTSHSVKCAIGRECVEQVEIARVDERFRFIEGTERILKADTVCIAVGLTPSVELLQMAGAKLTYLPRMGGYVPIRNRYMQTSVSGIYVAGDAAGIEEASSAMEEGRLAGICIAYASGHISREQWNCRMAEVKKRLGQLRSGRGGEIRRGGNQEIWEGYERIIELEGELGRSFDLQITGSTMLCRKQDEKESMLETIEVNRKNGKRTSWMTTEEIMAKEPILNPEAFCGGVYCREGGNLNPFLLINAYIQEAKRFGAQIHTFTEVAGFETKDHKVTAIHTNRGDYHAGQVVCAAGNGTISIGKMLGFHPHIMNTRGLILVSEKLPPILHSTYAQMRQSAEGNILMGANFRELKTGERDVRVHYDELQEVCNDIGFLAPQFKRVKIIRAYCGIRVLPEDGLPIVGKPEGYTNLRIYVMHSAFSSSPAMSLRLAKILCGKEDEESIKGFHCQRFSAAARPTA